MSLQYIVDAYNLTNHPLFKPSHRGPANIQQALFDFIRLNRLTGSKNNRIILVFDGYPGHTDSVPEDSNLTCLFSRKLEADELIKKIIEESASPKNIVVVTDDKEVRLVSRFLHAQVCGVEEFICGKQHRISAFAKQSAADDFKLGYSKMQKINAELAKKWLK